MHVFYHKDYPSRQGRFSMLQEYMMRPLLLLFVIYSMVLVYLVARRQEILVTGIAGLFITMALANLIGVTRSKGSFLEIGFEGEHFYLRSAYDISFRRNLRFYPLSYANVTRDGADLVINYIEQPVRIRPSEWPQFYEIADRLTNPQPGNISSTL